MIGTAYSSVKGIKSRRMRWAGHVARMRKKFIKGLVLKAGGKCSLEVPGIDGRIILGRGMWWSVLD